MATINEISRELQKQLKKGVSSGEMEKVAKFAAGEIRKRTRLGFGVAKNQGTKKKLKKLSPAYKKQRKKKSNLSAKTQPAKSNLTLTGEMLDSLDGKSSGTGQAKLFFKSAQAKKKSEFVGKDRPFLHLSQIELKRVIKFLEEGIVKKLNKFLK